MAGRFAPVGKLAPANALCKPDDNPWKAPKFIVRRSFKVVFGSIEVNWRLSLTRRRCQLRRNSWKIVRV